MDLPVPDDDAPITLAEVVFLADEARVVLAADPAVALDPVIADGLMRVAAQADSAAAMVQELGEIAGDLAWQMRTERVGTTDIVTVDEA